MDSEQTVPGDALTPIINSGSLSQAAYGVDDEVIISAIKLNKYFGDKHVLKDIDFEVRKREVVELIGPSGSGNSPLILCLNVLEQATGGAINIHFPLLVPSSLLILSTPLHPDLSIVVPTFN